MKYVRFFISNGYSGCDYIADMKFSYDPTDDELDDLCIQFCYENAESYEYVARGRYEEWESQEDRDAYYSDALYYSSWLYITKEEFEGE